MQGVNVPKVYIDPMINIMRVPAASDDTPLGSMAMIDIQSKYQKYIKVIIMNEQSPDKLILECEDSDIDIEEYNRVYSKLLEKQVKEKEKVQKRRSRSRSRDRERNRSEYTKYWRPENRSQKKVQKYRSPYELYKYPKSKIDLDGIRKQIRQLPVYKKHEEILQKILNNQVVLITGDTGCGKSTQVPRIIYQYLKATKSQGKILCVQPRRLAALNLQRILQLQMPERDLVSFHIGMKHNLRQSTRIVFMTNGIFLQRFIHNVEQIIREHPFIILDQVHERDIDTDFILLAIKHVMRKYPQLRVILMSATIDNQLFRYYFSQEHIDGMLNAENFYTKCMKIKKQGNRRIRDFFDNGDSSDDSQVAREKQRIAFEFMDSRNPCPSIEITGKGAYHKKIFYLDTLAEFTQRAIDIRWGNMMFSESNPIVVKECYEIAVSILEEIVFVNRDEKRAILVFLPGLAEIQQFVDSLREYFTSRKCQQQFQIIQLHSTTLTPEISARLHQQNKKKIKIIAATNIAESSITVAGVKYVIDFCMTKEINFDNKSKLQNLQLIWASQASCNQRAGRTGRVCDGIIFRIVEKKYFQGLAKYSTPEIQRCSLDRIILRIMLLHDYQLKEAKTQFIFNDPGKVLGKAIQPPALKNIDASMKSLIDNGGITSGTLKLTQMGRLFVQLPVDITYSRMLVLSLLFGTYNDIRTLVSILSQQKNPFRKQDIQNNYLKYWEMLNQGYDKNNEPCDFYSLVKIYKQKCNRRDLPLPVNMRGINQHDIEDMNYELNKRIMKRIEETDSFKFDHSDCPDYNMRFKMTIAAAFIHSMMRASVPYYDQKMERKLINIRNQKLKPEQCLIINSSIIKKSYTTNGNQQQLSTYWCNNIEEIFRLRKDQNQQKVKLHLTHTGTYIQFRYQKDLYKVLFARYMQQNCRPQQYNREEQELQIQLQDNNQHMNFPVSKNNSVKLTIDRVLSSLGDIDYLRQTVINDNITNGKVNIDHFSINQVIGLEESIKYRYLVTNSKMQKSTGSYCRYASLMPKTRGICPLLYMLFYPYVNLKSNNKNTLYECIQIKKKSKILFDFPLVNQDIVEVNEVRSIIKNFYELKSINQPFFKNFWSLLNKILIKQRDRLIDEDRWQDLYLKQNNFPPILKAEIKQQNRDAKKDFMGEIDPIQLNRGYFSKQYLSEVQYKCNVNKYNDWKIQKLNDLQQAKLFITNTEALIACRQCQQPICKLRDLGPIDQSLFRTFTQHGNSLKQVPFEDMGDLFCTQMVATKIDVPYSVYACKKGHRIVFKLQTESKFRLAAFSPLIVQLPDGKYQQMDFDRLDMKYWYKKLDEAMKNKRNTKRRNNNIKCIICDQSFGYVNQMEKHLNDIGHIDMINEFKMSMKD